MFFAIFTGGISLRLFQYLMGRSIWEDEAHLALNFFNHTFVQLFQPLDYIQAGPILFLLGVKLFAAIFGYGEAALRALPFLFSIATLPLIYYIVLELTRSRIAAIVGFYLFSVNLAVIYFSSELKPYALDLSMYLLLVYVAVTQHPFVIRRRQLLLAISGCLALLLSNVAFIVVFCVVCWNVLNWFRSRSIKRNELVTIGVWAFVFLINYFTFIYDHPATEAQRTNYAFAFCPTDILSCEFLTFMKKTINETFFTLLLYISKRFYFQYVLLLVFFFAIRRLYRNKEYAIVIFICLPVIIHLLLSALHFYPFWYRLILYLVPCFICLVALGVSEFFHFLRQKLNRHFAVAAAGLMCYFFTEESLRQFPLWYREIKPSIEYVNAMPSKMHLYMAEPAHAYEYYYASGYAKKTVFRKIPWKVESNELLELLEDETSESMIFYIPEKYANVVKDLEKKGMVLHTFEYKSYGVAIIKRQPEKLKSKKLDYRYFDSTLVFQEDNSVAIWNGTVESKETRFMAGNYVAVVTSRGTPVNEIYPINTLYLNKQKLGSFTSRDVFSRDTFNFTVDTSTAVRIRVSLENDSQTAQQDRNTFLKSIVISPRENPGLPTR